MKKILLLAATCGIITNANAQNDPSPTVGDTGTVTFIYNGDTVTYVTVRGADNMVWLQQNLGAGQVATSANDPNAYGHYFQWGRWDDGHQVPGSTTAPASSINPNDPSGIPNGDPNFLIGNNPADWWSNGGGIDTWTDAPPASDNGHDPCSAIGPGWHLPTQTEFANLTSMENIIDVPSAFLSTLKLTAAGMREPVSGNMLNVGLYGQYWTATPSGGFAKDVTILSGSINTNDDAYRSYGFSLRCLTQCTGLFDPMPIMGLDTVCEGSLNTYTVPMVNNADSFLWTLPGGWSVIGPTNGNTISLIAGTTGGTISVQAVNSCDTTNAVTMNVFVNPLPNPVITGSGNMLTTGSFTAYQWMLNDTVLVGAQSSTYTAVDTGNYQVIVTDANGCTDTSAVFHYTTGIENINAQQSIRIYPNPATSVLNIAAPSAVNVTIYSVEGRLALQKNNVLTVDISNLAPGTYQVKLTDADNRSLKTEKLVIMPR